MNGGSPDGALEGLIAQLRWDYGLSDADIAALLRGKAVSLENTRGR